MSKIYIPLNIQRFATNGSYDTGGGYNNKRLAFYWSRTSYSSSGGYSDIYWTVNGYGGSGYHYLHPLYIGINYKDSISADETYHTVYSSDDVNIPLYSGTEVTSGNFRMYHNSDGKGGTFLVTITAGIYTYALNINQSQCRFYLDDIPRYVNITSFSVSKRDETSVTFNWSADANCDWAWYSINNGGWTNLPSNNVVSGLNPDTTYSFKMKLRRTDSQLTTESGSYSQTTYSYPYITNSNNFTVGNANTVSFYNPLGRNVTIHIQPYGSNTWYGGDTSTGTSISGYTNSDWRDIWYQNCTSKTSNTYRVRLTYGSQTNTTGYSYTYTISENANSGEAKPSFTDFDCEDVNPTILALTGDSSKVVLGYSDIQATIPTNKKATANKYASMSSYKMAITGNNPTNVNYSSSDSVNMTINAVKDNSVTVTAYDSRGFSRSVTKSLTNVGYTSPVIDTLNATLTRNNNGVGEQVTLSFSGTYWNQNFGVVTNTIKTLTYQYKTTSESNYSAETSIIEDMTTSDNTFSYNHLIAGPTQSQGFDVSTTYNIKVNWSDELSSGSFVLTLGAGTPKIAVAQNGVAIGSKYDDNKGGSLQIDGERFQPFATNTIAGGVKLRVSNGILYIRTDGNDA